MSLRWISVAALASVIFGCSATPASSLATATGSSEPGETLPATFGPSPTPAVTRAASLPLPPDPILLGAAVRVAVSELNFRERPSLSAATIGVLQADTVLVIAERGGPVEADGYTWYEGRVLSGSGKLDPLPNPLDSFGDGKFGWFAAAKGETAYVTRFAPRCPTTVDFLNVAAQLGAERLECFGTTPIVLEGTWGCGGCGGETQGTFEPIWLAAPLAGDALSRFTETRTTQLWVRIRPAGPTPPPQGRIVRVTGHFDDAAATSCRIAWLPRGWGPGATPVPIDPAEATLICRLQFVADAFEVLGVDPSFPSGG